MPYSSLQTHECHVKVESLQKLETTVNVFKHSHLHTPGVQYELFGIDFTDLSH